MESSRDDIGQVRQGLPQIENSLLRKELCQHSFSITKKPLDVVLIKFKKYAL